MPKASHKSRIFLFAVLFLAFDFQALYLVHHYSLTNDEPFEITGGYYYWTKGDVVSPRMNPPTASALQTLPLLFLNLEKAHGFMDADQRAYEFFFVANPDNIQALTLFPRLIGLVFALALGLLLCSVARNESAVYLVAVAALWAFDPTFIAHSALAKSDVMTAFFFLASVLVFNRVRQYPGWAWSLLTGVLAGMAITSKVTALALGPLFFILEAIDYFSARARQKKGTEILARWVFMGIGLLGLVGLVYLPGTLMLPDHRCPYVYFWNRVMAGWQMPQKGWAYFRFLGSTSDSGNALYLPIAFLLKSTLPFLVLFFAALVLMARGKIRVEGWVWITPLVFLATVLPGSSIGMRLFLPAFPFLYLLAGRAAEWMWDKSGKNKPLFRKLLGGLAGWALVSLILHFPNYLSYANELVPPEKKGYFFANGDLDWGQDTLRLARFAEDHQWKNIKLAYLSGVDPHFYGMDWAPWTQKDLQGPQPGWVYLVNDSFLHLAPVYSPETRPIAEGWISSKATGKVGDTWRYYESPGNQETDASPLLHSAPVLRYYWKGNSRVFY